MSPLLVTLPLVESAKPDILTQIYKLVQTCPELGFTYKESLTAHVRENTNRGTLWAAMRGSEVVGVATLGSRRLYPHLARHGEVVVKHEYRRQRIATALYTAQVVQVILEGRREVEDTIITSLSPWMHGPTDCGDGFLPSLKYTHYGTQPKRTTAFRDVALWGKATTELDSYLSRLPENLETLQVVRTEKVDATWEKNMKVYGRNAPELVGEFETLRERVLSIASLVECKKKKGLLK